MDIMKWIVYATNYRRCARNLHASGEFRKTGNDRGNTQLQFALVAVLLMHSVTVLVSFYMHENVLYA